VLSQPTAEADRPSGSDGDTGRLDTARLAVGFVRTLMSSLGWELAPAIVVGIALAVTEGAGLLLLIPLLETIGLVVTDGAAGRVAAWTSSAFSFFGLSPSLEAVLVVFMAVSIAYATLYRWHLMLSPRLEERFTLTLRHRLYDAIVSARWSFLVQRRATDLAHALTSDLDRVGTSAHRLLTIIANLGVTFVYVLVAARLSPALTAVVAAAALVLLLMLRGRTHRSAEQGADYSEASRRVYGMVNESLAGLKVAKSTGAEARDAALFRALTRTASDRYLHLVASFAESKRRLDFVSAAGVCVLVLVAVNGFGIRGASLLLLVFVFARVMPRMLSLQDSMQLFVVGLPAFRTVMRLQEHCEREAENLGDDTAARLELGRRLQIDGVSYGYTAASRQILHAVRMDIEAGRTTAIVGSSGSGKTTLADLVMGLLHPDGGRILVDGVPLTAGRLRSWRRAIGYVPQEAFLLHASIRANLAWAAPDATAEEMWRALDLASAHSLVSGLPQGIDTVVGDRGVRMSGGERQRLALARALLRQPSLLILDEATSALDAASEQQILDAIGQLHGTLTIIVITHRLWAVRDADVIHVLADGRVAESGSWSELSQLQGGLLQRLWEIQKLEIVQA
jgi:ATP-binding cassette subfamily C protein